LRFALNGQDKLVDVSKWHLADIRGTATFCPLLDDCVAKVAKELSSNLGDERDQAAAV